MTVRGPADYIQPERHITRPRGRVKADPSDSGGMQCVEPASLYVCYYKLGRWLRTCVSLCDGSALEKLDDSR